jgi:hypothetical protein
MDRVASLSLVGAVLTLGLFVTSANADPRYGYGYGGHHHRAHVREVCNVVKKCGFRNWHHQCRYERVCHLVRTR